MNFTASAVQTRADTDRPARMSDVEDVAHAVVETIANIQTQSQINEALVDRVLVLEEKMARLQNGEQRTPLPASPAPEHHPAPDRFMMYLGDGLALCRVLDSFAMYVDTRDTYITPALLLGGVWEPINTRIFSQLVKSGMVVVDVGANYGYYTLLAAAGVGPQGRIYAFEPEPRNFEILDRNLQINGFLDRVRSFPVAALDVRKKVELHRNLRNLGAHTLFVDNPANSPHPRVVVECVPLDELIHEPVDLIKLDAEGSEPFIFEGMKSLLGRSPRVKILMEFFPALIQRGGVEPVVFLRRIQEFGFTVKRVTPQGTLETLAPTREQEMISAEISTLLLSKD
jgi:FkbM family methyltransferase